MMPMLNKLSSHLTRSLMVLSDDHQLLGGVGHGKQRKNLKLDAPVGALEAAKMS